MNLTDPGLVTTALTAGGAPIWAAAIQMVIQVLKTPPQLRRLFDGREKLLAFVLAGLIVLLAFVAALSAVPPSASLDIVGIVAAFLSWFTLARLAMALFDDLSSDGGERKPESVLSAKGWNGK